MDLTVENKKYIDLLSHYSLLAKIRYAPAGDPWMQGQTGEYWMQRYGEKRAEDPAQAVHDSKAMDGRRM